MRVRLIHWNAEEAAARADLLRAAGYEAQSGPIDPAALRALAQDPPAAIVIDLSRLPSQGRDVAVAVRSTRATRGIPLVFVAGDAAKTARIRQLLPDAVYTSWSRIRRALKQAIAHPPADPIAIRSRLEGYAGTPLAKKLGVKPNSVLALVNAPAGFERTLSELPEGVSVTRSSRAARQITIWFVTRQAELRRGITRLARFGAGGGLWIAWPKKSSGVATDVTQTEVRDVGLAAGLVDFKVCAIDATWTGLRFSLRRR